VRYVVDTHVVIAMLAQRQAVVERLSSVAPEELGLSVLVIAELLFGARRSARAHRRAVRRRARGARGARGRGEKEVECDQARLVRKE
jgi:predicted nucleic acid-binding protein